MEVPAAREPHERLRALAARVSLAWLPRLAGLAFAAVVALALAAAWHDRGTAVDDAYITFRYADNLLAGHGLRWNPGSPPCEGYTNLTYVLAVAALGAIGVDPVHAALGLALAATAGIAAMLARAARRAGQLLPIALVPALALFGREEVSVHASRGLETSVFAALAVLQVAAAARLATAARPGRGAGVLAGACGVLLFLTRPDGVLISGTCWVAAWWHRRRCGGGGAALPAAVATWLLGGAAYAAWKLWYFGHLLPNPFYAKATATGFAGVAEIRAFAADHAAILVLAGAAAVAVAGCRRARGHDAAPWLAAAVALPWLAYGAKIVHEVGFAHRFAWPLAPLLAFGAVRGIAAATSGLAPSALARALAWTAFAAAIAANAGTWRAQWRHLGTPPPQDPYTAAFLRIGEAIRDTGIAPQLTLFCSNAGAVPFVSKAHHVDPAGLTDDGYCRRTPVEERARYQASLHFDVVLWPLFPASAGAASFRDDARAMASTYLQRTWLADDGLLDGAARHALLGSSRRQREDDLFVHMWFLREHGTLVGEMTTGVEATRLFVYAWKQSPHHDTLVAHLAARVDVPAGDIDYDGWPQPR